MNNSERETVCYLQICLKKMTQPFFTKDTSNVYNGNVLKSKGYTRYTPFSLMQDIFEGGTLSSIGALSSKYGISRSKLMEYGAG